MQTIITKIIYLLMQFVYVRISEISRLDVITDIGTHVKRPLASCYLSL